MNKRLKTLNKKHSLYTTNNKKLQMTKKIPQCVLE